MNWSQSLKSCGVLARLAVRTELRQPYVLLGRTAFFGLLMLIFAKLWQTAFASGMRASANAAGMLWYLAATEWITLSTPAIHVQIEEDVRDGSYAYLLARPLPYISMRLAEAIGQLAMRGLVLATAGFGLTFLAAGQGPGGLRPLLVFFPIACAAALVMLLFHGAIGMSAMWLQEASPVFWVWQKLLFILGGLMVPLSIYPEWLRTGAIFLPFYALLYAPARLLLRYDARAAAEAAGLLMIWGVAALALVYWLARRAIRTVVIGGG